VASVLCEYTIVMKYEMFLVNEDGTLEWIDASDCSPNCNKAGAQRRANHYQLAVVVKKVTKDGGSQLIYRVEPEPPPLYGD